MALAAEPRNEHIAWLAECLGRGSAAPISCADLAELAGNLAEISYAGGTRIYACDELPERVYILRSGTVELARDLGDRTVVLQLLRPGTVFGDIPLFLRTGHPTEARAAEDSTVLTIDSVTLFTLLGQRPSLARRWLVSVAGRMADMQDRVSDLLAGSLDRQVASWLLREAAGQDVSVSQQTMARLLGARRTSVNQSLRRLEQDGLVKTGYRRISVVDPERLRSMLGPS